MTRKVVIVGAGMGGLMAAIHLARNGFQVLVLEARSQAGGLAAGFECGGFHFDAGPYILLDRRGLEWAFRCVGLDLAEQVELRPIRQVYEVVSDDSPKVSFCADLAETAAGLERAWPGSGKRYLEFVQRTEQVYKALHPLLHVSRPGPMALLLSGGWRHVRFLMQSLASILAATRLPRPIMDAISIWTHVAGQRPEEAPSPLAFVPALLHSVGCFYPKGGIRALPETLLKSAAAAGVEIRYRAKVRKICSRHARVTGVETHQGEFIPADAVVSDCGVATYLELLDRLETHAREKLSELPLQSPGVCAYLAVKGDVQPPYLRFRLPGGRELCRLFIRSAVMNPEESNDGWSPARLLGPMAYSHAEKTGESGQRDYLEQLLAESWWREGIADFRVLAKRTPSAWGHEYHLYGNSMNPVMTARFMREGRQAHRSPYIRGLYLAGSATHPGQWVSFCAVSGILAADCVRKDLR